MTHNAKIRAVLAASAVFAHCGPLQAQPMPADAAANWTFETSQKSTDMTLVGHTDGGEATAVPDVSGHGNLGALRGNATLVPGLVGKSALNIPDAGNGFFFVPTPVIDTTRSFTVASWVKVNEIKGFQTFASIDGNQVSGFFLQLREDTGRFAFIIIPKDGPGDASIASALDDPESNKWYHVAGVYDAAKGNISLYVDGVLQTTVPFTSPWRAGGATVIGRGKYDGRPTDFVHGSVDDTQFYQRALTVNDIRTLATPGLVAKTRLATTTTQEPATLQIITDRAKAKVSPMFYGLMTEEINYSYDGGLYAELIQNRNFKNDANAPSHWAAAGGGAIALDQDHPLNAALTTCLRVDATGASAQNPVGAANDGYWGIPVKPGTAYRASFYAMGAAGFNGPLTAAIQSADGTKTYASAQVKKVSGIWAKYEVTLKTGGNVTPSADTRFVISTTVPGTFHLNQVSLFPPTYKNRPNGNRADLMELMAQMKPTFLRFPGGNYLEGNTIAERFDWKKTIGPLEQRPGHQGPWGYRSTDGMGMMEFLRWCDELNMKPLLAVYAGYSLGGQYVKPGPDLQPYVQDALDEIEYLTGDINTTWGARRAADGHPKRFDLKYVEIGNEDWFDKSGSYDGRFAQFHDAIKAKYPQLQTIATTGINSRKPDLIDEHYYRLSRQFERMGTLYDTYDRKGPKIFVGEWASQANATPWSRESLNLPPSPDLGAALGDAAFMTGMERNSDHVVLEAYAPLLVNVNQGGRQWSQNLIGYDALNSYGSPSFQVQAMFAQNTGDEILDSALRGGQRLNSSVTRDSKTGTVYVKVVNPLSTPQQVHVTLTGAAKVNATGTAVILSSARPTDTNDLQQPKKVVPTTATIKGLSNNFVQTFPPYSATVLVLRTK